MKYFPSQVGVARFFASGPEEIKYDFVALGARGASGRGQAIFTFGGDRETFDFSDPTNYLNVDNDVWQFYSPNRWSGPWAAAPAEISVTKLHENTPNPFNPTTTIVFDLAEPGRVSLRVYDVTWRLIRTLIDEERNGSRHKLGGDGRNSQGASVSGGASFIKLMAGDFKGVRKIVMIK